MKINDLRGLSSVIKVYIPAEPKNDYINVFGSVFSDYYGGATVQTVTGFWKSGLLRDNYGLVKEEMNVIYTFARLCDIEKHLDYILDIINEMKVETEQEAVSMEINGSLYFI